MEPLAAATGVIRVGGRAKWLEESKSPTDPCRLPQVRCSGIASEPGSSDENRRPSGPHCARRSVARVVLERRPAERAARPPRRRRGSTDSRSDAMRSSSGRSRGRTLRAHGPGSVSGNGGDHQSLRKSRRSVGSSGRSPTGMPAPIPTLPEPVNWRSVRGDQPTRGVHSVSSASTAPRLASAQLVSTNTGERGRQGSRTTLSIDCR